MNEARLGVASVMHRFGDRHQVPDAHPSTTLHQVHGVAVVEVEVPGSHDGEDGDALVTTARGAALNIRTADCAPVLLAGCRDDGSPVIGAVHAGWRGLYDGVLERAVERMVELGARDVAWVLGPCIAPAAYEFSPADLTTCALRFGPEVVAATADGRPALDLRRAVRSAAGAAGLGPSIDGDVDPPCTATALDSTGAPRYFSWRARRDEGRQISSIWIEP